MYLWGGGANISAESSAKLVDAACAVAWLATKASDIADASRSDLPKLADEAVARGVAGVDSGICAADADSSICAAGAVCLALVCGVEIVKRGMSVLCGNCFRILIYRPLI